MRVHFLLKTDKDTTVAKLKKKMRNKNFLENSKQVVMLFGEDEILLCIWDANMKSTRSAISYVLGRSFR